LKKGEGSFIHVTVQTNGKSGSIQKTVTVTTNDPKQSTVILNVKGFVKKAADKTTTTEPGTKPNTPLLTPQH